MVAGDEIGHVLRKLVLAGQRQAVVHVLDDDPCTLFGRQAGVIVHALGLVFDEAHGVFHLADVVVERAHPHQHGVGADLPGGLFSQIGHLQRMLESTGGLVLQLLQQLVVGVGKIPEA